MNEEQRTRNIETLARLAACIAGRDPDERHVIKLGAMIAFDDVAWRYPDFMARAEAAFVLLEQGELASASELLERRPLDGYGGRACDARRAPSN